MTAVYCTDWISGCSRVYCYSIPPFINSLEGRTMTAATDVPPFDTQKTAAEVRDAGGFSQQQADAIVTASVRATANLVTKAMLDAALEKQTQELRTEICKAINAQTWRYVAFTGAMLGAMLGLLRWLFPTP